jgi:rod shape-determining protein MreC
VRLRHHLMKRTNLVALILFVAAVAWVFSFKNDSVRGIKARIGSIFSPFIRTGATVNEKLQGMGQAPRSVEELESENDALKRKNQELSIYYRDYEKARSENDDLRRMLAFEKSQPLDLVSARILTRHSATWYNTATVDRGLQDNLALGWTVVTGEGLVGQIAALSPTESEVLLLTDETCQVSVRIEGTPHQGILTGQRGISGRTPDLRIAYLPKDANLPTGAKVYSTGRGRMFEQGILVGEVSQFRSLDLEGEAIVKPAVDFEKLKYVFVIKRPGAALTATPPPPIESKTPPPAAAPPVTQ